MYFKTQSQKAFLEKTYAHTHKNNMLPSVRSTPILRKERFRHSKSSFADSQGQGMLRASSHTHCKKAKDALENKISCIKRTILKKNGVCLCVSKKLHEWCVEKNALVPTRTCWALIDYLTQRRTSLRVICFFDCGNLFKCVIRWRRCDRPLK